MVHSLLAESVLEGALVSTSRRADGPVVIRCPGVFLYYVYEGAGFWLNFHVVFEPSFIGTRALLGILAVGCFHVFTRSLHKVVGNCLSINHISCKYPCGAWVWVTGAIPHTRHGVCACLDFYGNSC